MAEKEQCKFGSCKKYLVCEKKEKCTCNKFEPCLTYMDKYNNDVDLWGDLHGEVKECE